MTTPVVIYPNPPIVAGYPTAADPPLSAPITADLDDPYVAGTIREGGFLTAPREGTDYSLLPITGTAANTIGLVITLNYGGVIYEVVYELGAFTPLYSAGSTVNLGTGAYSIVRAGGFPPGVTVHAIGCTPCPPCPPPPSSGQSFGVIYKVDFTALPNQVLGAAGAYTIDGKTWYAKNPNAGPFGADVRTEVVNGSGLGIWQTNVGTGNHWPTGNVPLDLRHLFCPLAQFTALGYNPAAPLIVRWHMTDGVGNQSCVVFGLCDSTNDGVGQTAALRVSDFVIIGLDPTDANRTTISTQQGQSNRRAMVPAMVGAGTREIGIYRLFANYEVALSKAAGSWTGTLGDPNTQIPDASTAPVIFFVPTRTNPGLIMGISGQTDASHMFVTHLELSQPRIP
jgi:hypothetical protein